MSISRRTVTMYCWLLCMSSLLPLAAPAAPVPVTDKSVTLLARETSVNEFLVELFGLMEIPVVISDQVKGTVNGDFTDTASSLLDTTMKTFQLVTYYDGQVAHVYNAYDLQQKLLPVSAAVGNKIIAQVQQLNLIDRHNNAGPAGEGGLTVRGTPRFIEQVNDISRSIRKKSNVYVPQVVERLFYLRHAWVQDSTLEMSGQSMVVPGVVSILNELISQYPLGNQPAGGGSADNANVMNMQSQELSGLSNVANTENAPPDQANQPQLTAKTNTLLGKKDSEDPSRVVAVPQQNAVLVRDIESRMPSYAALIRALDVEPYMLEIEATIIDVSSDRSKEIGVNWRYRRDDSEALVGNGTISDQLLNPDQQITPQGQGGILSLSLGNPASQFLSRIRALETEGEAEIVSKPHVVTLSNVEAVLDTTQSFFVRVASAEDASLFKITAGTTLRVTPHVYKMDGKTRIKLMVDIQDGATSDVQVDQIPVIGNSTIRTQAIITDGDSLLVGGLVRESKRDAVEKVPLLGDIPGLGSMFRTDTKSGGKVERLFLITPRLAFRDGFNSGRRMDAPILQGQQGEIIGTSAQRLQSTKDAMQTLESPQSPTQVDVIEASKKPKPGPTQPLPQPESTPVLPSPNDPVPDITPGQQIAQRESSTIQNKEALILKWLRVPATASPASVENEASVLTSSEQPKVNDRTTPKFTVQAMTQPDAQQAQHSGSDVSGNKPAIDINELFKKQTQAQQPAPITEVALRNKSKVKKRQSSIEHVDDSEWQAITVGQTK